MPGLFSFADKVFYASAGACNRIVRLCRVDGEALRSKGSLALWICVRRGEPK